MGKTVKQQIRERKAATKNWITRLDKDINGRSRSQEYNKKKTEKINNNINWRQLYAIAHRINNQKAKKKEEQRKEVATQTHEYESDTTVEYDYDENDQ